VAKAVLEIRSLARLHTKTALKVLAGIMKETSAPAAARVAAASELLSRGWGKPQQSVDMTVTTRQEDIVDLIATEIERERLGLPVAQLSDLRTIDVADPNQVGIDTSIHSEPGSTAH
jgi:hypothetical protein